MTQYITSNPEIMGGMPCITGTRIPISTILYRLRDGHSLSEIHEMYSWVDRKTLTGAINEAIAQFDTKLVADA